jgi:ComF family protein
MVHAFKTFYGNAESFIFPNLCIACRNSLTTDKWLCDECLRRLGNNRSLRDACPLCGQNRSNRACSCSVASRYSFEAVYSLFDFDETIKAVVHEIKYKGQKRLAYNMGKAYGRLVPAAFFDGMHVMAAVPLHFFRRMQRGYNQAEHLARGFAECYGPNIEFFQNILIRKRPTKTQTKLSRAMRKHNVQGAFIVSQKMKKRIENKNIILVDDIITTGATIDECANALLAAGSGVVRALSLVRD